MTELRELIATALVNDGQRPWLDRVVETGAMTADLGLPPFGELPFVVVRQVQTVVDLNGVRTESFEVWVHAPAISFAALDALERQAIGLLDRAVLVDIEVEPNRQFVLRYAGTLLGDQIIDTWDAYARGLRFESVNVAGGAEGGGPISHDDPRAQYLRSLGTDLFDCFGMDWCFADPAVAPPSDDCPFVYIRPTTGPRFATTPASNYWVVWYVETLVISVSAPSQEGRDEWVDKLALALPRTVVGPDGDTWFINLTGTNYAADPDTAGQITFDVTFGVLSCEWEQTYPPFREAVVVEPGGAAVITPPPSAIDPRAAPILAPRQGEDV